MSSNDNTSTPARSTDTHARVYDHPITLADFDAEAACMIDQDTGALTEPVVIEPVPAHGLCAPHKAVEAPSQTAAVAICASALDIADVWKVRALVLDPAMDGYAVTDEVLDTAHAAFLAQPGITAGYLTCVTDPALRYVLIGGLMRLVRADADDAAWDALLDAKNSPILTADEAADLRSRMDGEVEEWARELFAEADEMRREAAAAGGHDEYQAQRAWEAAAEALTTVIGAPDWGAQARHQEQRHAELLREALAEVSTVADIATGNDDEETTVSAADGFDEAEFERLYGKDALGVEPDYAHPPVHPDDVPTSDPAALGTPVPHTVWVKLNRAERRLAIKRWRETIAGDTNPFDPELYPLGHPSEPALVRKIVEGADWTRAIFHHARGRRSANPVGAVLVELIRTGMACPPDFGPYEGVPLSTFVVFLGRAGSGKGQTMDMPRRPWAALTPQITWADKGWAPPTMKGYQLGSGHAFSALLQEEYEDGEGKKQVRPKDPAAVLLWETEMSAFFKRGKGDSSTLIQTALQAWSMESVGTVSITNGDRTAGVDAEGRREAYSTFLAGGLQPKMSWEFQQSESVGFHQRFVKTAVPDPMKHVHSPAIGAVKVPADLHLKLDPATVATFTLCDEIAEAQAQGEVLSSRDTGDPLEDIESHMVMVRIRLACLYALRCGRTSVTFDDWVWSGWVMEHSRRSVAYMEAAFERYSKTAEGKIALRKGTARHIEQQAPKIQANNAAKMALPALSEAGAEGLPEAQVLRAALGRGPSAAQVRAGAAHPHQVLGGEVLGVLRALGCTSVVRGRGTRWYAPGCAPRATLTPVKLAMG
ncbi:hypothetical protein [Tsukamurella pseudospumae]|uniref:DUF3987 domain-containing protein n=1 Tax=Tsukamurella pseudospumae TaxID=239498 RepID=A0A138ATZ8_9ACTN|nr:hypothetical protein [Tsukamurella pseudospumae]KXP13918.1 hypothetical protein AXK60_22710 [Tsukamurella pseudospumae]